MDLRDQAAGIGALADDTRRRLYAYVAAQPEPVTRDQAATALGLTPANAYFHLDKLVAEGLLDIEFRRLSGRSGPGAGRPSKLYRRSDREFSVSLPGRRYELVGDILAGAVVRAEGGELLAEALDACARAEGVSLGGEAGRLDELADVEAVSRVLETQGYEPRPEDDAVVLANCPFDSLARKHTALVCGLNRTFVQGVADGMGRPRARACLEPAEGRCCVAVRPAAGGT